MRPAVTWPQLSPQAIVTSVVTSGSRLVVVVVVVVEALISVSLLASTAARFLSLRGKERRRKCGEEGNVELKHWRVERADSWHTSEKGDLACHHRGQEFLG